LLVITPDGAIEYVNERKPLTAVNFDDLTGITLQVHGQSFSDSTSVTLQVWIDLHHRDGRKTKWRSTSFADNLQAVSLRSRPGLLTDRSRADQLPVLVPLAAAARFSPRLLQPVAAP
jgi:hypothetical protein